MQEATLTNLAAEFAKRANSQEWVDFFDVLLGSLISLLRRIFAIHNVIMEAIETANNMANSSSASIDNNPGDVIMIPEQQLASIKVNRMSNFFSKWKFIGSLSFQSTSKEVLINVCDQVVERSSKILTQRCRSNAAKLLTTEELCSMAKLVELLNKESLKMTGRVSSGNFQNLVI